ncbi:EEIG1/EHBP1 N-terminal domain-containing protein [Cynara cardunculus var. scolymus]|uniref:EEIG1/EHBP1 N-terminal domain-containing protein n=1 Tax=Cynara cardunculus var. scolymus TaxID=59895 RepID=A0A103Y024_CYNCS|nr:EEIG1/EHBP1 N-terminal domain-containing protein [Cynara cardunculus var. scolymus]
MVVKMMKWRPWPPLLSRKFQVKLAVKKMEGANCDPEKDDRTIVEIKWKGPKITLGSFRRTVKRDYTRDGKVVDSDGVVWWDEEFHTVCTLSGYKENDFLPWEIGFTVLNISLGLKEMRAESMQSQSQTSETSSEDHSALKAGLRKVNIFKEYVSIKRGKKAAHVDDHETRSDDGDVSNLDESGEGIRKSFSYGTLAYANWSGGSLFEDDVYYRNHKSDADCSPEEDSTASVSETYVVQNHRRSILPWKKRKLNFRSPKAKGEPLLKKGYGEEGGDDIDFDRRQLSSDESLLGVKSKSDEDSCVNRRSVSEFGDDSFTVGNWEPRDIISRDGCMKLQTHVFFASIDQRSEQAAGEGACTALVAVIADWFQNNRDLMPIKSQFDSLIREGSSEWRSLCDDEIYMVRFPDKHFDLETVLEAKLRPLAVIPGKSFVGFFHPDEADEGSFDFLHGAMSFDNMWDEISRESEASSNGEAKVYIVSWNDHFFVLKVDSEAYYIIDTLGERLFEGCNQAYILKFDQNSAIFKLPASASSERNPAAEQLGDSEGSVEKTTEENDIICCGKESCKEYIKNFLAAIPIRELQADIKKGLVSSSTPLHHRLQIEFHYTRSPPPAPAAVDGDPVTATSAPATVVVAT